MCGIIGYVGNDSAKSVLIDGLHSLEYRGYDSAGIAIFNPDKKIEVIKTAGRVSALEELLKNIGTDSNTGIGHTRWATHGKPNTVNAHPHASDNLCIVHNGIIDNYAELKTELIKDGYIFKSETDTEVAAHLIDSFYKKSRDPVAAIYEAAKRFKGSYAIAVIFNDHPQFICAVRKDNPLIVCKAQSGCCLASDIPALNKYGNLIYRPYDGEVLKIYKDRVMSVSVSGKEADVRYEKADMVSGAADKGDFPHYMLKEIYEEPAAIKRCVSHRISEDGLPDFTADGIGEDFWQSFDSVRIIACGSASYAGEVGAGLIESLSGIPAAVSIASEYRYDPPLPIGKTLALFISQSGETADTLAGLRLAKALNYKTASIINVFGSAIARESDYVMYTNAGPEIAVATTKGYSTQTALLSLFACKLAVKKGKMSKEKAVAFCNELKNAVPKAVFEIIERRTEIEKMTKFLCGSNDCYYIGRGLDYYACIECSLKLKEVSYIHSEAYPAGELKHGTLALIHEGVPVIALCTDKKYFEKMSSNIREVRSRGGFVILLSSSDFPNVREYADIGFTLPKIDPVFSPLLSVVFAQLLAYYTAVDLGCDVDHPKNLAKSVTVE